MMDLVHESDVNKDRKFIVFESQLMQLFQRCHSCRAHDNDRTSDILRTFTLISGQLVTWPVYMSALPV